MQVIASHINTDFDALASMLAAHILYPEAQMVLSDQQSVAVRQFMAIYRDELNFVSDHQVTWAEVTELILVDVASLDRIGAYGKKLDRSAIKVTVYDHHPTTDGNVKGDVEKIEPVGAAVTLLIEEIMQRSRKITSFEATVFGLGLYTDTGSFAHNNTTHRDFQAACYLMKHGMNLEIIQRFSNQMLSDEQQEILNHLFLNSTEHEMDGLNMIVSYYRHDGYQGGLSTLTRKLLEITEADAVLTVVEMQKRVYIVGRARSERINFLPLLSNWGGGGHPQAGSATMKGADMTAVYQQVCDKLETTIQPAITARMIMSSPVAIVSPDLSVEEAAQLLYQCGHTGFPVVQDDVMVGMISRRDLDKAKMHGLEHAPVKGYMSTKVVSIDPDTSLEEIQRTMIRHNIGRLPVVDQGQLVGILSRTDIIEVLHKDG